MTCTADGFVLNRRSNRQSPETNTGFEKNRELHNVFLQMCGSKQKCSHLTLEKLSKSHGHGNAETACKSKLGLKVAISKDEIRENTQFSGVRANEAILSSDQAVTTRKCKHEPVHKKARHDFTCPHLASSSGRWPALCALKLPAEIQQPLSLRESREQGSSMFLQYGNLNGRQKRCRTGGDAGVSDHKRRKSADNKKQWESMDVAHQKLPAPFCNKDYQQEVLQDTKEVLQDTNSHFRELTSAVFPPFLSTNPGLLTSKISGAQKCRTNYRRQWREYIMEFPDLDIQIIKQDIGVFHRVLQKLLIKSISLQKKRYSIYIPSWKDTAIRIHGTSGGRYRTDNPNTGLCSAVLKSCQSTSYRFQTKTYMPIHNSVNDSSLKQLQSETTMRNCRDQQKVRSQIQTMRLHWLSLPWKYQQRLEVSPRFILVLDKHLRVIFVSGNVSRHLGYQQEDMLGRSIGQFIHPKQMPDLSRLTRGRHFQTDDKHCVSLWKTGRVMAVAMKFSQQKTRTGFQDTGYKPVLWTVNLRLKKRGRHVRAWDMVILCKPMHDCTVTGLQMGRNVLINPCDLSFNFHVCNFSSAMAERTLYDNTMENLNGINCLCFGIESELLNVNHDGLKNMKNINHSYLRGTDSNLTLKQLLQSCFPNLHVCSSCISKWWTKMGEISNDNYHSSVVNHFASMALQSSTYVCKTETIKRLFKSIFNSPCQVSQCVAKMCPFSAACANNFPMARSSTYHEDVKMQGGIKLSDSSCRKSFSRDIETNQKCFSPLRLPLQKATSINCLNQTSSFFDNISPHLLMKASRDHENILTDELMSDKADISDDSKSTSQDVPDVEFAEIAEESEPESLPENYMHKYFSFDCLPNVTQILTGSKQPDQILSTSLQLPLDFKEKSTLQLFSCQCQNDAKSNCSLPEHVTSDICSKTESSICSKTESSSLLSILQMENISPGQVRKKVNEDVLLQTCPAVCSFDSAASTNHVVRKRSNTLLHNFLLDLASTSAYSSSNSKYPAKQTPQAKSSNPYHQDSSASSTLCSPTSSWSSVTNQRSSESTSASADDYNPGNTTLSRDKVTSKSKSVSFLTKSPVEQTEHVNTVHRVSSKMANQKYDPFLSQASFSDFNAFPSTDMFDDLASVACPVTSPLLSSLTSQIEPGADQDAQSHLKDHFSSSNFHNFLDPAPESTSFISESLSDLDSLLNIIPVNHATNAQTVLFSGWPESDTSQSSDSISLSNYFFNKETISKPSLLRKLLDKEGSAIQETDSDTGWILDQLPKKNSDVKTTKLHCGSTKIRYSVHKQAKNNKSTVRSVEIPKLRLNMRQMMQFNKYKPQYQKPTKELPLPSSITAAGTSPSCALLQQDAVTNELASPENSLDKEMRKSFEFGSSDHATNCELPDDLIDMDEEFCAPLEMDETEALISDLNDSCSWEDNLYSLLESSAQENSGSESPRQPLEMLTSKNPALTCELLSSFLFQSKDSFSIQSPASSTTAESSFLHHRKPNKETPQSSSSQTSLPSQKKITSQQLGKANTCSSNAPSMSTTNCTNTTGKMSLLRAAITSDVDKLIEQIPLRKVRKPTYALHRTSEEEEDDPDILITKVTGLQENHGRSSVHKLHHKVNKVITASTASPSENISLSKALQSSKTTMAASSNVMSLASMQTFTTNGLSKSCDKWQLLQNGSSCEHYGNTSKIPPIINPLVIKITIGSSSTPKVICARRGSQNNLSQHFKSDSQTKVCDTSSNPSFPRAQKSTSTDLSSTQPVSVMIMRKEHHRPRRSKSIAIQTDNEPGEVYPEFEHNPSDTILYPSTIITYPSAVSSPQEVSPLSTPLSSHSSHSETDKFLPSHPSTDDSSSSADDDYRTISSTPFLWKLLTGELSKDHYQRLDQQMIENERKKSSLQ